MSKRFTIVIAVATAAVMALGAQTATSTTVGPVDSDPPDLRLSGPKRQNPQRDHICDSAGCEVIVKVRCGDEACIARAKGRLTKVKIASSIPAPTTSRRVRGAEKNWGRR